MKFKQEFTVAERVPQVWAFFQKADAVAQCMPGIDNIQVVDPDQLSVRMTQKVGPISASFDTNVRITERQEPARIQFTLIGKAVRGAVGNFRATNTVTLHEHAGKTHVVVEGEAALAGALGSVGQRIIAKQAEKLTAEFAVNLARALSGETGDSGAQTSSGEGAPAQAGRATPGQASVGAPAAAKSAAPGEAPYMQANLPAPGRGEDPWNKVAASFSVATFIVSLFVLYHVVGQG
ncbi:MAG TPA: carbon monoxide dehydrogenase [Pusillimonas sp.]|nr:carbon monoxide dehydrogenase [Pusillimonas sp.]